MGVGSTSRSGMRQYSCLVIRGLHRACQLQGVVYSMSLTSFLLGCTPSGKKNAIDTELDAFFHSQVCCVEQPRPPPDHLTLDHVRPSRIYLERSPYRRKKEETQIRRAY